MAKTLRIEVSSAHNPAATPVDGEYIVAFIRKQLLASEVYPDNLRYNPSTGNVEYSPDGGTTWVPSPESDPRNQITKPPQTGTNADCNSAASEIAYLVKLLNLLHDGIAVGAPAFQLGTGLINILVNLGPWAILFDVASALATVAIVFGLPAIDEILDPANLDELTCLLLCRLTTTNQISEAGLTGFESDVSGLLTSNAAAILNGLLSLQGFGGVNNAMALKLATDDCSGCSSCSDCANYSDAFTSGLGPKTFITTTAYTAFPASPSRIGGTWSATGGHSNAGCVVSVTTAGAEHTVSVTVDLGQACHVANSSIWFKSSATNVGGGIGWRYFNEFGTELTIGTFARINDTAYHQYTNGTITVGVRYITWCFTTNITPTLFADDLVVTIIP